jgi:hypothetical protein
VTAPFVFNALVPCRGFSGSLPLGFRYGCNAAVSGMSLFFLGFPLQHFVFTVEDFSSRFPQNFTVIHNIRVVNLLCMNSFCEAVLL